MPTESDFRLEAKADEKSKVICNYCDSEIGEVYTAHQTPTGRSTGRSEEDIDLDIRHIVRDHLPQCEQKEKIPSRADYESRTPNQPPETAPLPHQRSVGR